MPTIARVTKLGEPYIITKTAFDGVKEVSCSCCCFCAGYDLGALLYAKIGKLHKYSGASPYGTRLREQCGDLSLFNSLKPTGGSREPKMQHACLRFLCRSTYLDSDGQPVSRSTRIGGPTYNDVDLDQLVLDCMGESGSLGLAFGGEGLPDEEYNKCYLYTFDFYGWKRRRGPWVSSDALFDLWRLDSPL